MEVNREILMQEMKNVADSLKKSQTIIQRYVELLDMEIKSKKFEEDYNKLLEENSKWTKNLTWAKQE